MGPYPPLGKILKSVKLTSHFYSKHPENKNPQEVSSNLGQVNSVYIVQDSINLFYLFDSRYPSNPFFFGGYIASTAGFKLRKQVSGSISLSTVTVRRASADIKYLPSFVLVSISLIDSININLRHKGKNISRKNTKIYLFIIEIYLPLYQQK